MRILFVMVFVAAAITASGAETEVRFNRDIRPILAEKCLLCHGPDAEHREAELRLDREESAKASRDDSPAVVAGKPRQSALFLRITSDDEDERMPPADSGSALTKAEVELFKQWILQGAKYEAHWSFVTPKKSPVPKVKDTHWSRSVIDPFILARLESAAIRPAADADRRVWIRRVYFDLVGLPPSPEEVEALVDDKSETAYEKVVDRLLDSPHFGERWARHWFDLVRYAETYGYEHDWPIPLAWRYRDYVIRMFNADVPYDQVVREHIAGDLMPHPRRHPTEDYNESIIATGFWYLHGQMSQPVDLLKHEADRFDNQIDVFSRSFLGVTMACARCHDHKFDPISTKDYYSLAGFLRSSRRQEAYLDPGGRIGRTVKELTKIRREADARLSKLVEATATEKPREIASTVVFEDFNGGGYDDWYVKGYAFSSAPTGVSQWDRNADGIVPVRAGLSHSGMLAGRLRGTLQSRDFTITHPQVWLRVSGKGKIRIVINGYMMQRHKDLLFRGTELKVDVPTEKLRWVALGADLRLYQGHSAYLELEDDSDSYLVIDEIRFAKNPPLKSDEEALRGEKIKTSADEEARFSELRGQIQEKAKELAQPLRALSICDGPTTQTYVLVRGNVRKRGAAVQRRLPASIAGEQQRALAPKDGSGRLALAEQLVAPSNPLVARVRVNWVWHHLFGCGIVPTVDNFGALGQMPSHVELLDYLAVRFVREHHWSMKSLIREMVLSRTYRMSSKPTDALAEKRDPTNTLLHRMRVRRLEGETIRDAMLSVSGRLDRRLFGPPVPVHLTPFMQGLSRPKKSGPLDGNGRRSLYIEVRRNFLPPMFLAFDTPVPSTCVARRNTSNVPAQALILMNDPFVAQQADVWAQRIIAKVAKPRERIDRMFRELLGRSPTPREIEQVERFMRKQNIAYGMDGDDAAKDRRLWADFAHALLNVKQFIFLQ